MAVAQRDLVDVVSLLLQKNASVKKRTKDGRSALHIAAVEGRANVIRLLFRRGAKIDVVNKAEWTPLMLTAKCGHRQTVMFLVKNGASLVWKDNDDQNAAGGARQNNRTDVLDLLRIEDGNELSKASADLNT
ncbi:Ankyrin repeat-containing domain [Phytophthora cactorum]|nr:Ankyrin repeat-containing domain [Phytophthora cactorum]